MGVTVLTNGIKTVVELAKEINTLVGKKQIGHLDIGGGLPANYKSDAWVHYDDTGKLKVPTYSQYADHLKKEVPELFTGEFEIVSEFGQSLNAKLGFLASRIEWMKGTQENPIAIVHFGGSECVR